MTFILQFAVPVGCDCSNASDSQVALCLSLSCSWRTMRSRTCRTLRSVSVGVGTRIPTHTAARMQSSTITSMIICRCSGATCNRSYRPTYSMPSDTVFDVNTSHSSIVVSGSSLNGKHGPGMEERYILLARKAICPSRCPRSIRTRRRSCRRQCRWGIGFTMPGIRPRRRLTMQVSAKAAIAR